jgi:hypothetical protein
VGHAGAFAAHRRRLGAVDLDRERFVLRGRDVRQVVGELPDQLRRHGLPDLRPVAAGVRDVVDELADPGDFLALSTGDPCPDNGRITDDGVRLFDFEAAAFRHALVDAAHYRVPFPNCWCWRRLPEDVARAAQAAHQEAFTRARPGTRTGDPAGFTVSLGRMATAWALWTLHRRLPAAETSRVERRRILQTLTNLRAVTSEAPHLGDTATWAEALHQDLAQRWPADRGPAATYPAFGGPPWDGC